MRLPLVSILIANYNNKNLLERSINSCKNQSYKNKEIIVFDDLSDDGSQDVLKKIKNIKVIYNKKKSGFPYLDAMNAYRQMFKVSKGKFIFFLDSDDFYKKNKINILLNNFKNKNIKFIQDLSLIKNKKSFSFIEKNFFLSRFPYFGSLSSLSVERIFFKKFLNFDKNNKIFYNVWLDFRLCAYAFFREKTFFFLRKQLTIYDQSLSTNQSKKYKFLSSSWIIRRYYSHLYINYLLDENFFFSLDFFISKVIYRFFYNK
jgi:glycosyltransferase involved in cell wall biosynthesis